jgi:hypothetical protein
MACSFLEEQQEDPRDDDAGRREELSRCFEEAAKAIGSDWSGQK